LPDDVPTAKVDGVPAFDAQAAGYDARTGFPPGVGEAVADAIVRMAGVGAEDLLLELGAGTGEIGVHLAAQVPRYLGFDTSPAMLDVFRAKASPRTPDLLVADGDAPWPVSDASARVIFASRVIHLLHPGHVAHEARRVCEPGGYVMLGRATRDPDSVKERLRRRRQQVLRGLEIQPRSGEAGARQVIERLVHAGWSALGRQNVATWTGNISAGEVIAEWESLTRMGSVEVDGVTRERILGDIREWAAQEFGDLERVWPYREQYVLDIVQLPERRNA
jgi:ubiquinone/menaquinone biosynthesis C-methylase UbiE